MKGKNYRGKFNKISRIISKLELDYIEDYINGELDFKPNGYRNQDAIVKEILAAFGINEPKRGKQ